MRSRGPPRRLAVSLIYFLWPPAPDTQMRAAGRPPGGTHRQLA